MSFTDEYLAARKKKKDEEKSSSTPSRNYLQKQYEEDIAPIGKGFENLKTSAVNIKANSDRTSIVAANNAAKRQEEKKESLDVTPFDLLSKGTLEDGYQFGDVFKGVTGTMADLGGNLVYGAGKAVEGIADAAMYLYSGAGKLGTGMLNFFAPIYDPVWKLFGTSAEEVKARNTAQIDGSKSAAQFDVTKYILGDTLEELDKDSFTGETSDAFGQGLGNVGFNLLTGAVGKGIGLAGKALTAFNTATMFTSGFGNGMSEAYESEATDAEAITYGVITGAAEALSELMFSGTSKLGTELGYKGVLTIDDAVAKKLTSKISNQAWKNISQWAIKAGFEGVEEIVAGLGSAFGKWVSYRSEDELADIIADENLLEQWLVGFLTSLGSQGGDVITSTKAGTDLVTESAPPLTENEESVVNKVFDAIIAEKGKVSKREQNKIREGVIDALNKGYVSTDVIEEMFGGDTYTAYQDALANDEKLIQELSETYQGEELEQHINDFLANSESKALKNQLSQEVYELVKDSRLGESYRENARKYAKFDADLTQYDEKQQAIVKKAIESGVLNNTRRSHELVDLIARISAEKGLNFDFTNNENLKNSGFAIEGKTINGFVNENGDIVLNSQSQKYLNTVVGHEITHVLEGTEIYKELQETLESYAKSRKASDSNFANEYAERLNQAIKLYKNLKGYEGTKGFEKIKREVVADLVGDYLFTDENFVTQLSAKNRNLFQKLYDEIKYLCKVVTAGSKEARELERVKRIFEKAYKAETKITVKDSFEMTESVEETKDLLAMHNITSAQLTDVLGRESLIMPSFAVTNKGVTDFGEITLLFDKSSIDPDVDSNNKLFGADAWTPTQTAIKKNAQFDEGKTNEAVDSIKSNIGEHAAELFDVTTEQFQDTIAKADGNIYEAYAHDIGMQTAYAMEKGIISQVPVNNDGTVNTEALQKQLNKELDTDEGWRQYKKWLNGISDSVITSYDAATNQDILNNMKSQPATAKTFKLSESGELVVPAAEYGSIDELRSNKDRLSENAEEATKAVADEFLAFADKIDGNTTNVVEAINKAFDNRYSVADIVKTFGKMGIDISTETATELQDLYKKAVELPTLYFEAKPGRYVGLNEVVAAVVPNNVDAELKQALIDKGYKVVEYDPNVEGDRQNIVNSFDEYKFSVSDSDGKQLSKGQQEYFKDSKIVDEKGNLLKVYHGSPNAFTTFRQGKADGWGTGIYFTNNKAEASEYGNNVVEAYLNITNPYNADTMNYYDIGAENTKAYRDYDMEVWKNRYDEYDTYEEYKADGRGVDMADIYAEEVEVFNRILRELGYDGIIADGSNGIDGLEIVAFNENQPKLTSNENPTTDKDIRYSLSDSEGRKLSDNQSKYFADSKVVDDNGNLQVVYHGSGAEFTEFSYSFMSTHGSMEGQGFYFTDNKTMAEGYQKNGAKLMQGYLDIKKPLSDSEVTLKRSELTKLLKAVDPTGDDVVINYDPQGGMGYPSKVWYNRALAATVDAIYDSSESDSEILADLANSGAGTEAVVRKAREVLGYDGYIVADKYDNTTVYVAFESNQFKNIDNLNPTTDPDIRHSLSAEGEIPKAYGDYRISSEDVAYRDIAPAKTATETAETEQNVPITENVATETVENMFPDGMTEDEEYDSLDMRRAEIETKFEEAIAAEDWDTFTKLNDEYDKVKTRLADLEVMIAERESGRLDSLDDADAPPVRAQYDDSPVDVISLTKSAENDIARTVRNWLGVNDPRKMGAVREIIREYAQNDNPNRDDLADALRDKFGTYTETTTTEEEIKEAKQFLRRYPIFVDESVKKDIPDFLTDFKKRNKYKLLLRADGSAIDEVYHELNDAWPDLFPLTSRTDDVETLTGQLLRMEKVANMTGAVTETRMKSDEEIYGAADAIIQAVSDYRNAQKEKASKLEKGYLDSLMQEAEKFVDVVPETQVETSSVQDVAPSAEKPKVTPEQEEKIAEIRRYDPKAKEGSWWNKARKRFNEFVTTFGDKAWVLENLSKKTGNRQVEADYDFMQHRSRGVAQQYIKKNLMPFYNKVKGLAEQNRHTMPIKEVNGEVVADYESQFDYYTRHLLNIDRMSLETPAERSRRENIRKQLDGYTEQQIESIASEKITRNTPAERVAQIYLAQEYVELGGAKGKNRPVFAGSVTADVSRQRVAAYERMHPEFKALAEEAHAYFKSLRNDAVKAGLVKQKTASLWEKMYPHYVPISRTDRNGANVSVPLDSNRTGVNNPFKRAEGGNSDFEPLLETMAKYTVQVHRAIHRNNFGKTLMDALETSAAKDAEKSMDSATRQAVIDGKLEPGTRVKAHDRDNIGTVESFNPKTGKYTVYFENKSGQSATVSLDANILTPINSAQSTTANVDAAEMLEATEENDNVVLKAGENGRPPQFTVFVKGKPVTFDITEDIYNALQPAKGILGNTYGVLNKPAEAYKKVLTKWNPIFSLFRNPIKDAKDVFFNSRHAYATYAMAPEMVKDISTNGKWTTEFIENGGESLSYYNPETHELKFPKEHGKFVKGVTAPLRGYDAISDRFEMFWRVCEYAASRKKGESVEVAMLDAARVTTNFGAGGDVTKFLNRNGALFLNPSVQGFMQNARNVREAYHGGPKGIAILAAKILSTGLGGMLFNWLLWDDDEEYEELSDYVKQNYLIVGKTDDGKFIRIPKGRAEAVIQNAFEQMGNLITGNDDVDMETFAQLVGNNLAPNNPFENQLFSPIQQAIENRTWYGEDLVPTRLQDMPVEEQYDESTDVVSKRVGETFGISPYKVNYVLKQYGGGFADMIIPALTPQAEGDDLLAPVKDEFVSDPVFKNQNVTDFYNTVDELKVNANSAKATDEDILKSKYMNSVNDKLSELYSEKRYIQNGNMSDEWKQENLRRVQAEINEIAKDALANYETINRDGDYAEIGGVYFEWYTPNEGEPDERDPYWRKLDDDATTKYLLTKDATGHYATDGNVHYRLDEEGKWTKISDKQLARQNEVTKALGITPDEYWSKTDISFLPMSDGEYEYAFDNPGSYAVAKAVGGYDSYKTYSKDLYNIKADKDSNGKSINGSRKKKVLDYINSLDADYETRIILWKSEYPSDDTYNAEILEYLNGRSDLTYEERIAVLEKLGAKVDSSGRVKW